VFIFDRSGGPAITLDCACTPTGLFRLAGAATFRLTELAGGPLQVLDANAAPRIVAVPPPVQAGCTSGGPPMRRLILLAVCLLLGGFTLWGQVVIAPATLPNEILGDAYSQTITATSQYQAQGHNTFSLASGTPPSGLNLAANGTLSGTLTAVGTFTFTVQCVVTATINVSSNSH